MGTAYKIFIKKIRGKSPLRRRKRRCEDNIKADVRERGWIVGTAIN
jgi:hypothetical protein